MPKAFPPNSTIIISISFLHPCPSSPQQCPTLVHPSLNRADDHQQPNYHWRWFPLLQVTAPGPLHPAPLLTGHYQILLQLSPHDPTPTAFTDTRDHPMHAAQHNAPHTALLVADKHRNILPYTSPTPAHNPFLTGHTDAHRTPHCATRPLPCLPVQYGRHPANHHHFTLHHSIYLHEPQHASIYYIHQQGIINSRTNCNSITSLGGYTQTTSSSLPYKLVFAHTDKPATVVPLSNYRSATQPQSTATRHQH